ncbi:nucleotidyltransferase family protein [Verminephrobacter eiseniae]|uniref:nucleotidyltransferase family protein n=1 Tax=Verminephrobacter eiseniae TaxID=364317 RepID=UPI0022379302|nr:nucleotidyltransferase family protein [Verminephrobacter eiseniae]MCW5236768.1 nucleotidyl transferase [Verminephrobacter eiseniae]
MLLDATQNMLPEQAPVLQAIRVIDQAQAKIALVVDAKGRLTGSVVDGDVRRGLLRGHGLQTPVRDIMHRQPYTLPVGSTRQKILQAMQVLEIKQVPLVSPDGMVTGIAVHDLLLGLQHGQRPNQVVVMAGGKGQRLLPITQDLPKPMVPVGGKPILEWILLRLRHYGFREFSFAINYLGHMIEDYFGDGSTFDCRIRYIREKEFLGTAGALSLLPPGDAHPLVVTNGDILSGIDFGHLVDFHAAGGRSATVCARAHRVEVPYGVIQMSDGCLQGIVEKPVHDHLISAGIYVLSPQVLPRIPQGQALDMPELLLSLIDEHHKIGVFVLEDEWVDVGRHDDLERVKRSFTDQG